MKRKIAAVIFDMDGVLTDTEPVHFAATNAVLAGEGKAMTWEQYEPFIGTAEPAMWKFIDEVIGLTGDHGAFSELYNTAALESLTAGVEVLPGAREAVAMVRERGLKAGLASSSRAAWVEATLKSAGLTGQFDAIVAGDMLPPGRGKPEPDIFRLTAERLGVAPGECVVLEDSPRGITAARAAGMLAVGVRSKYKLDLSEADDVIDGIADFDIDRYLEP
ncbi:MAG: HAD family phosphatase [Dehalococcoidia bacterium]